MSMFVFFSTAECSIVLNLKKIVLSAFFCATVPPEKVMESFQEMPELFLIEWGSSLRSIVKYSQFIFKFTWILQII